MGGAPSMVNRRLLPGVALAVVLLGGACGDAADEGVSCVTPSEPVQARFGDEPFGATEADDDERGAPRWFYGRPEDVLFISDIDPEGDGTGEVRPLTANAVTYAEQERAEDGSTFPDDGPASLSFASNESSAAGGRAMQCAPDP